MGERGRYISQITSNLENKKQVHVYCSSQLGRIEGEGFCVAWKWKHVHTMALALIWMARKNLEIFLRFESDPEVIQLWNVLD